MFFLSGSIVLSNYFQFFFMKGCSILSHAFLHLLIRSFLSIYFVDMIMYFLSICFVDMVYYMN